MKARSADRSLLGDPTSTSLFGIPPLHDRSPPWLFFFLALPQGVYFGFVGTAMPWMLKHAGIPVDQIASASAIINLPSIIGFVVAPLVDLGRRRKLWLLFGAATSAAMLPGSMLLPLPGAFTAMTALLTLGALLNAFVSSAVGALMAATLRAEGRGMASGWFQAGNVGGGAVGGGLILATLQHVSLTAAASVGAAGILLPALAVLPIAEPKVVAPATFRGLRDALFETARDRRTHQAAAIFLSPMGACALIYLFTALGDDYRASPDFVTLVSGIGGGIVIAVGSLLGGLICRHMERRMANIAAGTACAFSALLMMMGPLGPATYAAGTMLYSLTSGLCYAAYVALVLDVVDADRGTGATRFSILNSAANLPVSYMTWADGQGYAFFGPRGMLAVDGGAALLTAIVLYSWVRRRPMIVASLEPKAVGRNS
ncbi:MAG TPA: MFS transporter [Alphaproteobacteria bacterium]|nr:MFS transporter [Alphaproteobacteria bacterium]